MYFTNEIDDDIEFLDNEDLPYLDEKSIGNKSSKQLIELVL